MFLLIIVLKIILIIFIVSLAEWIIHKYVLHGKWIYKNIPWLSFSYREHTIEHHGQEMNKVRPHIDLTLVDYLIILPFSIIAFTRYFYFGDIGGLSSLIAQLFVCATHIILWNKMHRAIHELEPNNWTTYLPWYNFIKNHHIGHHKDPRTNLNVVFPMFDYILGTVYKRKS